MVKKCRKDFTGLIDSGSDVNLVWERLFFDVDITTFVKESLTFIGLSDRRVSSLGNFKTSVTVFQNNLSYCTTRRNAFNVLLGQEFLTNAVVILNQGSVTVMPKNEELWLNKSSCAVSESGGPLCFVSHRQIRQNVEQLLSTYTPAKIEEAPIKMKLTLTDDVPVAPRPRRLALIEQREVYIGEWLNDKIIHLNMPAR